MFWTVNDYAAAGHVQVVRVPQATSLLVESGGRMTAPPWDGRVGGIIAVHVNGAARIDGQIDVSGMGFRGGAADNDSSKLADDIVAYRGSAPQMARKKKAKNRRQRGRLRSDRGSVWTWCSGQRWWRWQLLQCWWWRRRQRRFEHELQWHRRDGWIARQCTVGHGPRRDERSRRTLCFIGWRSWWLLLF